MGGMCITIPISQTGPLRLRPGFTAQHSRAVTQPLEGGAAMQSLEGRAVTQSAGGGPLLELKQHEHLGSTKEHHCFNSPEPFPHCSHPAMLQMVSFLEHTLIPHVPLLRLLRPSQPAERSSVSSSTRLATRPLDLPASLPIALSLFCTPSHPKLCLFLQAMLLAHAVCVLLPSSSPPPTNPPSRGLPLPLCLVGLATIPHPPSSPAGDRFRC